MLYAYSDLLYAHSKYSGSNISIINVMEAPSVALCALKIKRQVKKLYQAQYIHTKGFSMILL
jgi:hypothetical protein